MINLLKLSVFVALLGLAACTPHPFSDSDHARACDFGSVRFESNYQTARFNGCEQIADTHYQLFTSPESDPINPSAWYGFKVVSGTEQSIKVTLKYRVKKHRYPPKVSVDKKSWSWLPKSQYEVSDDKTELNMSLKVSSVPLYISAQEIIDNEYYALWGYQLDQLKNIKTSILGYSMDRRAIHKIVFSGNSNQWVLITGRQHPPEVTGALSLFSFVDTILQDTELANKFRKRFNVLLIPNLNPDGVAKGNWRYNNNNIDLNRDWGIFAQPEIQLVEKILEEMFATGPNKLLLGLDFHSTTKNVLYTQEDGEPEILGDFTLNWFNAIKQRMPDYVLTREASPNKGNTTFKQYIGAKYGIPSITYELDDDTDREDIKNSSIVAAEEMMRLLLLHQ